MSVLPEKIPKVAVAVFIFRGKELLLLQRKGSEGDGDWAVPGGRLEHGETLFECGEREVLEETGVKTSNPRLACITQDFFGQDQPHFITIFLAADYLSGEARVMELNKAYQLAWFSLDNLPSPLFFPTKNALSGNCIPAGWLKQL